jgi:sphingomyelin phosphodiesterase acid-like 3
MTFRARKLRVAAALCAGLLMACGAAHAQSVQPKALLISDIHFDPFHDPAKVSQLAAEPVSAWEAILAGPDSPTQATAFPALQAECKMRGEDTPYPLLVSALNEMKKDAADVRFITMSGDMLAHKFACRFQAVMPAATPAQYEAFVEKTIEFEANEIEMTLPHATAYLSLGNNDSNCDDNKLDTDTPFLQAVGKIVGHGMGRAWNAAAAKSFATGGYYSVTMNAPMQRTRLIVVNDIFLGSTYTTCKNKVDGEAGAAQMQWLTAQLDAARRLHERVWVMGHIPPGVNPYSTLERGPMKVCTPGGADGTGPVMFMTSEVLGDTLVKNADVIRLAIFAHTHDDELRLLGTGDSSVALKMVPSITTINGNNPAITVAQVDPATATMADYTVFAADAAGSSWAKEYTFSEAYGHAGFTPETLRRVVDGFQADAAGTAPASAAYMHNFAVGLPTPRLPLLWQGYVCALTHTHAADYAACACGLK